MQSTFKDPIEGEKGKGRVVMQFGSFYDYSDHCIRPDLPVEPMDDTLNSLIDVLISSGALPASVRPNTAIINIYNVGDNIPPHIDHTDYPRPFSILSLQTSSPILFGTHIIPLGSGKCKAPFSTILERRSLLVLEGNGGTNVKRSERRQRGAKRQACIALAPHIQSNLY